MKTFALIYLSILWTTSIGQWNINHTSSEYFTSLYANGTDTIIAYAYNGGRIQRSFDGGNTWSSFQTEFTQSWLLDMDFPTPTFGYVCGGTAFGMHNSCLAKTTDGGVTWDSVTSNQFGNELRHLDFLDKDLGIISGDNALILTIDGGLSFTNLTLPFPAGVTEINIQASNSTFIATTHYIASGISEYNILHSTDLGNTWTTVYSDTLANVNGLNHRNINKIQFVSPMIGFAVGGNGLFLKTANGGQTWNISTINPYTNLSGLSFIDENIGYINNAGGIYRTVDGGLSWTVQQVNPIQTITDVIMISATEGFACSSQSIYKTTNSGISPLDIELISTSKLNLYPNPSRSSINIKGDLLNLEKYEIFNSLGKLVKSGIVSSFPIQIEDLAPGLYSIKFIGKTRMEVEQFIKN